MANPVNGMALSEFTKVRTQFEAKARDRKEERLNAGDDTPWYIQVLEEMVMGVLVENAELREKVAKLQALLGAE